MTHPHRRDFLKTTALAGAAMALAAPTRSSAQTTPATTQSSANNKIVVAICGTNSRGLAHIECLTPLPGVEIGYICDVDDRSIQKGLKATAKRQAKTPIAEKDFRKMLDDKSVDAVTIATPDHWHTPLAIMALAAGKHVYVEKPCSQNAHEGEMLVQAAAKSNRVLQVGAQRRSFPNMHQGIAAIHDGIIGKTYFGRTWYVNNRVSIGHGKPAAVPAYLDYDLWQGPAPRKPYMSNLIHYNWHWFWNYGTGEALNNGTHEVDVCRWAMGLTYPERVTSNGGRYAYDDDWQTPDTQVIGWDFPQGATMSWEGRSCNDFPDEKVGRGAMVYGTKGSALLEGNNCTIYNKDNKILKTFKGKESTDTSNTLSSTGIELDALHFADFIDCIRTGKAPNSPALEGHISTALLHLGNIAWRTRRLLNCDPTNGHILNDEEAMKMWQRTYEPGWEPKV